MRLDSKQIYIRRLNLDDLESHLDLRVRNREFLKPVEPLQIDHHYTLEGQKEVLEKAIQNWEDDCGYGFGIFSIHHDQLIGRINLSNVVRGAWESCTIGYFLDQQFNGKGLATEAVRLAIHFAFRSEKLHRVQAAVMPKNKGSIRVLEKVGFRYDGYSEYYLKINDTWEHHNLYSITQEH